MAGDDDGARPGLRVVAHVAVSLDGATTGFDVDVARYYELAAAFAEDTTLTGADTILAQEPALRAAIGPGPAMDGPLLAVVDSRSRVSTWRELRDAGYWRDVVAVRLAEQPGVGDDPAPAVVVAGAPGDDHVDLDEALRVLAADHGARSVRIDSGGALLGAAVDAGLVDELSLLVHPVTLGATAGPRWWRTLRDPRRWRLRSVELVDGLAWLRLSTHETDSHDG